MSTQPRDPAAREAAFRGLYEAAYADLLRFVQRRAHAGQAEDVVADTFMVAWRRFDEVPTDRDDARAWLFGVARRSLLNDIRSAQRRVALAVRIAEASDGVAQGVDADLLARRLDVAAAWPRLTAAEQEVLALTVWEDWTQPMPRTCSPSHPRHTGFACPGPTRAAAPRRPGRTRRHSNLSTTDRRKPAMSRATPAFVDALSSDALRDLDPAETAQDASGERAQSTLAAILAVHPAMSQTSATQAGRRSWRPKHPVRWVAATALAMTPLAAAVLVPGLGGSNPAYATWSAKPVPVNDVKAVTETCRRDNLAPAVREPQPPILDAPPGVRWATPADVAAANAVVTERRGDWTLVVMTTESGFEGVCLSGTGTLLGQSLGSTGAKSLDELQPFQVEPRGWIDGGGGSCVVVTGRVGSEVRDVWVRDNIGLSVKATVSNGYYAAWWPDSKQPLLARTPHLTVRLADGTTFSGGSVRPLDRPVGVPDQRP